MIDYLLSSADPKYTTPLLLLLLLSYSSQEGWAICVLPLHKHTLLLQGHSEN